jgi:hypothetical protein
MKWLRLCLQTVGALSVLLSVVGATAVAWNFYSPTSARINKATRKDSVFILNWGGISTNQDFKVVASYQSSRSLTGDHLDYYCIDLPKFEVAGPEKDEWHVGPEKNPLLADALDLAVNDARQYGDCVPSAERANSDAVKIMFVSTIVHGHQPTAADIILYDTNHHKLYYVSFKT